MTARRLRTGLALGALASMAVAGQASAATKTVVVGADDGKTAFFNDFFRHKVAIHKGDSVSFEFRGFHNVYFPKKGGKNRSLIVPDPSGTKYSGLNDAAGAPMWFNDQLPRFIVDPIGAFPSGGTTYDGSKALGSGLPLGDEPKPFAVTFTKKGSFTYYCTVHPGMKGQVSVLPKSAKVPTAKQDAKAVKKQLAHDKKLAKQLDSKKPPKLTIWGGSDKRPVANLKFYPSNLQVKSGDSVTFAVNAKGQEPHTLSIGSEDFLKDVVANQITPDDPTKMPPTLVFDGRVLLPSDPGAPLAFDGTSHGGFFSTGAVGAGAPAGGELKFKVTAPAGTYHYICLIHPEMTGTITVK